MYSFRNEMSVCCYCLAIQVSVPPDKLSSVTLCHDDWLENIAGVHWVTN